MRVRAQVMTRDDSAGGWVAMGGGGLSNVSVKKLEIPPLADGTPHTGSSKFEYVIFGKRISDQSVVLSCTITRDFTYNKVMPTFHHWQTGDKKFGLTFQAAADARAFDQGVRNALQEYLHDTLGISLPTFKPPIPTPVESSPTSGDEDDVFMALELPSKNNSSHSSSQSSGGARTSPPSSNSSLPSRHPHPSNPSKLPPFLLDSKDLLSISPPVLNLPPPVVGGGGMIGVSYVGGAHGDELKKPPGSTRLCKVCHEQYNEENNPPGSCRFGPAPRGGWLRCIPCAQYLQDKCDSAPPTAPRPPLWLSLSFLLCCCCGLIRSCQGPCSECGLIGARHEASEL